MPSPKLAEGTTLLIRDYIQTNITASLAALATARPDNKVTLESPRSYFTYENAKAYLAPAIFVITEDMEIKNDLGPNFIYAMSRVIVSAVCEDQTEDLLNLKTWRYQSALYDLLALREILSADSKLQLKIVPKSISFSAVFRNRIEPDPEETVFRKEVVIECEVHHKENY